MQWPFHTDNREDIFLELRSNAQKYNYKACGQDPIMPGIYFLQQ